MASLTPKDVLVLVPAHNESSCIQPLVQSIKKRGHSVLLVDDGSTDDTVEKAKKVCDHVEVLGANRGKGAGLKRGFEWFLKSSFQAIIIMDGDGQHDPADLEMFLASLNQEGTSFVLGNRMHSRKGMPLLRVLTNRFMSWILSSLSSQRIPDTQCGYRAIKREVIAKLHLLTTHFELESEMLLEAARLGFKVRSIPIRCVYNGQVSGINPISDTWRFFSFLFAYLIRRKS